MHAIDFIIVGLYLAGVVGLGWALARRAGASIDHYFLGGRGLPWWALGASGMASNLDIAGTMTIVTLLYLYGLHGFFMEMRGGVVLPIAVFLAFMGKWHRRSRVMTTAEWMTLRFGDGAQGKLARLVAALTYLVITIGMVHFFLAASGKFFAVFLPFSPSVCAASAAGIALIYTLLGGLYGVVWTDVVQAVLIGAAALYVSVLAAGELSPEVAARWPGAAFNDLVPRWSDAGLGAYAAFAPLLVAWVGKGVLEGLGGSGGSAYMAQRFYAARSDRECTKIGVLWTLLFAFRWPMVVGFVILAAKLGIDAEPETILPRVLASDLFPVGFRGLVIAAMLAAAMSTFDSTINAGAAYAVRDIYQPLRPEASERALVQSGYIASTAIVAVGLLLALVSNKSVVEVWITVVIQLFPAFLVPFALRWYWPRMNGAGFSAGVLAGFGAALLVWLFDAHLGLSEAEILYFTALCSLGGSVAGSLLTEPVAAETLRAFYDAVRPFGWWPRDWREAHAAEHKQDIVRLARALSWQVATFLTPMALLLRKWEGSLVLVIAWGALTWTLWRDVRSDRDDPQAGPPGRARPGPAHA
ncbi:MAG: sodium:solute symporter [Deltaproteobacteria bacterium]|nr:sodium:solute symporter [Deltaproteobacteria bacterium]